MAQRFPFGRGGRGSRQRLIIETKKWGGLMMVHEASVKVLRTHAPDFIIARVGISCWNEKRCVFFTSQIFQALECLRQAAKDFQKIRRVNKITVDNGIEKE